MSGTTLGRSNIYPTDEDLFIAYSESLPIISSTPSNLRSSNSLSTEERDTHPAPPTFITHSDISQNHTYADDQIIPWRKLHAKQRIEESALQSSLTSSNVMKFLIKYNRWPIIITSSIIISFLTIFLDWSSTWLNDIKYGYCKTTIFGVRESCGAENWHSYGLGQSNILLEALKLMLIALGSIILALIGLFISRTSFWISKSGISELKMIILGHVNNEFLQPSIIVRKFIALIFVCSCGGLLVGYEGPLIHISCGVISFVIEKFLSSSLFFQNLNNEAVKREIISIGFVIGISLAFGAPIGGLLFSIENLRLGTRVNTLAWNGFVCSSIATFIFFEIHPFKRISINEAFKVDIANGWILFETLPYVFVGLVCGLLSLLFCKLHMKLIDIRTKFKTYDGMPKIMYKLINNSFAEISLVVLMTHLLAYPLEFSSLTLNNILSILFYDFDESLPNGYNLSIYQSPNKLFALAYYFIMLFILSNYSYCLDIPGGMLLPSLTIGATLGRIIGELVQIVQTKSGSNIFLQCYEENKKCVSPGSYAIVGAASFFAGFTNTSVAAVVIVFELTGAVTYLIPLMLGVVVSKTVVDIFGYKGFDELWLMKISKTYLSPELTETMSLSQFSEVLISDAIGDYDPHILYVDDVLLTVKELAEKLDSVYDENSGGHISNDGFVLLTNKFNCNLVGWINFNDLNQILKSSNFQSEKLVSFMTTSNEVKNENIIELDSYIVPSNEIIKVNAEYSLLSAYELMNRMLITNIFVCSDQRDGSGFKGILRMADLAKLIKK
ncbi:hypothetical protein PMKS-004106 [Pichia membranifaciens]|uniref:Uncharacterized protein n=1 Tax=Pichia membranifaciens TaxID=4926 RepID=A0A1Q2YM18_9ASCO|nr:hypothetical protein PMKS-004106 [Pichia membranifaciens]